MMGSMLRRGSLGDGSTLSLDFTTGVLDPRITFTRASGSGISGTGPSYIGSNGYVQYAGTNVPRFDHDPTTLQPRGLLVEGSAVNLAANSNLQTAWAGGSNTTVTANTTDVLSPDGTNNAAKVALTNAGYCSRFEAISGLAASTTYTFSYWIRGTAGNQQRVYSVTAGADLVTQTTLTYSTTGWTRIQIQFTTTAAVSTVYVYVASRPAGTVNDVLYIFGAQVEAGIGASSLIPTGASTATRNADNAYIYDTTSSGGLSWFKTVTQGTFYVEAYKRTAGTAFAAAAFGTRATSSQDFMLYQAVGTNWLSFNWGANEYTTNYSALSSPFLIKAAVALSPGSPTTKADSTVSINGSNSALNTGPNIVLPFTSDLFCIGSRGPAAGTAPSQNYAENAIRRIKFFPFAMSAAQMNALTTL